MCINMVEVVNEKCVQKGRKMGLSIRINITDLKELVDAYLESNEENTRLKAKIIELEEQTKK